MRLILFAKLFQSDENLFHFLSKMLQRWAGILNGLRSSVVSDQRKVAASLEQLQPHHYFEYCTSVFFEHLSSMAVISNWWDRDRGIFTLEHNMT